ncbi:response regulator [Ohtaekwangia koreensis]|uniref:Two-component system, unclassified family, response regulator n=1 Tax=Ohtaekwangia koreensis TaxID=688867 RepID=A0A1T5JTU5_9BACT|nr:response regulator [Ohtaekwangia koreensis]SKC54745.1 two-component system, unclassified family, response regulator [Ohtaekwangia koreensis]
MEQADRVEILLVEDNPDDAELTIHALKQGNSNVNFLHINDGVEALNFVFEKKSYENKRIQKDLRLVLLDLKLPKIDGLEILKKIRENDSTKSLPVVILTSSREKKDIITAYGLGVNSYVVKPVEFEFYVHVVKTITLYWNTINEKPV